ncbi:MAG: hypothetical protein QOG48_2323, partial [Verrucomicrobiota bacterium]
MKIFRSAAVLVALALLFSSQTSWAKKKKPPKPNLVPYQPSGWSDKIVITNQPNAAEHNALDSAALLPTDTLYIDWAVLNDSNVNVNASFSSKLYIDNVLKATFTSPPPILAHNYQRLLNWNMGSLSVGQHTIGIQLDSGNVVVESNQSDNVYTKTITISAGLPNLTPYQPPGWSDKIVVTNQPNVTQGSATDSASLEPTDSLYLSFAINNVSNVGINLPYNVALYIDNVLSSSNFFTTGPTAANGWWYWPNQSIGSLGAGQHTIGIQADSVNIIAESNEGDNSYTKTIAIASGAVVLETINQFIFAAQGGTISLPGGSSATFAPNTFTSDNNVTVSLVGLDEATRNGFLDTTGIFEADAPAEQVLKIDTGALPPQ